MNEEDPFNADSRIVKTVRSLRKIQTPSAGRTQNERNEAKISKKGKGKKKDKTFSKENEIDCSIDDTHE
jgi:hypothetical protein